MTATAPEFLPTACPAALTNDASRIVDTRETAAIFARIGGRQAIEAVVDDFYRRVLGDPALAPAFEGVSMTRLRNHQISFLAAALGGEADYQGRSMRDAHAGLGITAAHFTGVAAHLHEALRGFVPPDEIEAILVTVAGRQAEIVERP